MELKIEFGHENVTRKAAFSAQHIDTGDLLDCLRMVGIDHMLPKPVVQDTGNFYTESELSLARQQGYEAGVSEGEARSASFVPGTFPIPADVWNGAMYGEYVSIEGFPPMSIPAASPNGYEIQRKYTHKDPNLVTTYAPEEMTQAMLDSGDFVALLIVVLR